MAERIDGRTGRRPGDVATRVLAALAVASAAAGVAGALTADDGASPALRLFSGLLVAAVLGFCAVVARAADDDR